MAAMLVFQHHPDTQETGAGEFLMLGQLDLQSKIPSPVRTSFVLLL